MPYFRMLVEPGEQRQDRFIFRTHEKASFPLQILSVGDPAQELFRPFFPGVAEQLFRGSLFHNGTVFHEDYFIGYIMGKTHFMGDYHHSGPLPDQLFHHSQYFVDQFRVQGGSGFIEEDHFWIGGNGPGNPHPLLLSAGKLLGIIVVAAGKSYFIQGLPADLFCLVLVGERRIGPFRSDFDFSGCIDAGQGPLLGFFGGAVAAAASADEARCQDDG